MTKTARTKATISLTLWLICLTLAGGVPPSSAAPTAAPSEGFAHAAIRARWERDDGPVAARRISRTWLWGPGPFYTNYEPFEDAPAGNYLVQYFDKGRLEISDPEADPASPWFVTSGLLVKEMVTGRVQTSADGGYDLGPARAPVAGDGGSGSTYADFAALTGRAPRRDGHNIEPGSAAPPDPLQYGPYEEASGHNWAAVFRQFATAPDRPAGFDWLYTLGLPITEPQWVRVPVAGVERPVLVQLFERRLLTYNPANPPGTRVEMGNAGRHYWQWRYGSPNTSDMLSVYDVTVSVGRAPGREVSISQRVALTNSTNAPLRRVVMRATWHRWDGVFTLGGARVNGTPAQTAWRHGVNLEIMLPQPLSVNANAVIQLEYLLKPRAVGGRTGYDRATDILSLGDAIVSVVPWEYGGWSYYPYSELGDFGNGVAAQYRVEVRSPAGEKLVAGGTGVGTRRTDGTYVFEAKRARDVAYIISPRFIDPLQDASMTRLAGSVRLLGYFLPEQREAGRRQLDLSAPALAWFAETIGAYPFDTFTVAAMGAPSLRSDNYAQEYPGVYLIPAPWLRLGIVPGEWTWYIPVHEVGHQWFYSTVGNNQIADPWLDEALTTYFTAEYTRLKHPSLYQAAWRSMTGGAEQSRPVSAGVFGGYANEAQYTAVVYDSGTLMLDRVRRAMGDADFYAAILYYYSEYAGSRAGPLALVRILQAHADADLAGIFAEYLGY
jgi:hypothetical protein